MPDCPECSSAAISEHRIPNAYIIVGNLSVGKSTVFRQLCGDHVKTEKYPGTSVTIKSGTIRGTDYRVILTPGSYSLFARNEDETVSRDILLDGALVENIAGIILVADAKNLKRSLAICLQYMEYGIPILLAVNMTDEAASRGIQTDYDRLATLLGIDVVPMVAREGIGIQQLIRGLAKLAPPPPPLVTPANGMMTVLNRLSESLPASSVSARSIGLLLLADDPGAKRFIASRYGKALLEQLQNKARNYIQTTAESFSNQLAQLYNTKADQLTREVQSVEPLLKSPFLVRLGDWCTQLHTGLPIAFLVIAAMYLFVGTFGATYLVDTINGRIFSNWLIPMANRLLEPFPIPFIREMIIDPDFGILPTGIFLALGLVMPVLFCFYFAFGILQHSGYLPRLSILLDKIFQKMGLNGRGVIPLVMGFSCVTMAILTTRMLGTKKERFIATVLLLLGMPCAPLIAVMLIILDKMPLSATITLFGLLFTQTFLVGVILNKIMPGPKPLLIMEIPPLRIPKLAQVLKSSAKKTYFFMKEAVPVFILASALVFIFERLGGLHILEEISRPLVTDLMGLPEKSVQVFIKTLIRRENGAAELQHISSSYTNLQLLVNLLVMTCLTPCVNAVIVVFKERGIKNAVLIIGAVFIYAILAGSAVNHICHLLNITFT